jgi:hypothetical protein
MILLSDLVLRPGLDPDARYYTHLRKGQMLNLPTDEDGFFWSEHNDEPSYAKLEPDEPILDAITLSEATHTAETLRIDVGPDWESDARSFLLQIRLNGLPAGSVGFNTLSEGLRHAAHAKCHCGQRTTSLDLEITTQPGIPTVCSASLSTFVRVY